MKSYNVAVANCLNSIRGHDCVASSRVLDKCFQPWCSPGWEHRGRCQLTFCRLAVSRRMHALAVSQICDATFNSSEDSGKICTSHGTMYVYKPMYMNRSLFLVLPPSLPFPPSLPPEPASIVQPKPICRTIARRPQPPSHSKPRKIQIYLCVRVHILCIGVPAAEKGAGNQL